uniref:Carboxylesterase type B domain-containing protein n=1 Tax=Strigamia maritima TaxID=126957 RepID=T1JJT3_STRMM
MSAIHPLGFLSSQSRTASGNYGLRDIIMALQWIQNNIYAFSGDSNRITLMGHGSGAAAVSLLVTSPLTKGLFHKAILQSGTALCSWSVQENARQALRNLSAQVGCSTNECDDNIMSCLRKQSAELMFFPVLFAPVVDGDFIPNPVLPASPDEIYRSKEYNYVPMMVGETTHEALQLTFDANSVDGNVYSDLLVSDLLKSLMDDGRIVDDVWESVKETYFRDVEFSRAVEVVPPFVEGCQFRIFLGDITVSSCVDQLLRAHVKSPIYYYVYGFRKYTSAERTFLYKTEKLLHTATDTDLRSYFQGAAFHGDDLSQLFTLRGSGNFPPPPPITDFNFTASMLCLFTSFITLDDFSQLDSWNCRNPFDTIDHLFFVSRNGTTDKFRLPGLQTAEWPPFDRVKQRYLHLNSAFSLRTKYRHREKAVLENLLRVSERTLELRSEIVSAKEPYFTVMWIMVVVCAVLLLAVICLLVGRLRTCGNRMMSYVREFQLREVKEVVSEEVTHG